VAVPQEDNALEHQMVPQEQVVEVLLMVLAVVLTQEVAVVVQKLRVTVLLADQD
tara:strand:- start:340 stop:501 length:162 start_codon:yes stop_codon:yes gene_type:complete